MALREIRGIFPGLLAPLPDPVTPVFGILPRVTTGRITRSGLITQPIFTDQDEIRTFPLRSGDPVTSGVDALAEGPAGLDTTEATKQQPAAGAMLPLLAIAAGLFFLAR